MLGDNDFSQSYENQITQDLQDQEVDQYGSKVSTMSMFKRSFDSKADSDDDIPSNNLSF